MLEGLVAAGFYSCFCGNKRRAALVGAGVAGLLLALCLSGLQSAVPDLGMLWLSGAQPSVSDLGVSWLSGAQSSVPALEASWLQGLRSAVPVLTALWMMLIGFLFQKKQFGQREELLLMGGTWLLVRSLGGLCVGSAVRQTEVLLTELQQFGSLEICSLQVVIATALLAMGALYLLGRGKLYPLWVAVLAILWLLTGFLGSIAYAKAWQQQVMAVSLYLVAGGILVFQQISCIRQNLERAERKTGTEMRIWRYESSCGDEGMQLRTGMQNRMSETESEDIGRRLQLRKSGRRAEEIQQDGLFSGSVGSWRESAEREYQQLQIFEHDFRHHLDVVAALYEEGSAAEARAYMEDLKQARVSRQGLKAGGERELTYIMMAKRQACRQAKISFSYQIVGSPRGIAQMDMTALLLNLLDNAIRACREMPEPRSIGMMLLARGELWEIELTNSGRYQPGTAAAEAESGTEKSAEKGIGGKAETATRTFADLETETGIDTGRKIHGIGMVSVRQIVDKYQGTYRIWQEEGQVRQKLILVQRNDGEIVPLTL